MHWRNRRANACAALALCAMGAGAPARAAGSYVGPWVELGVGGGFMLGAGAGASAGKAGNLGVGLTVVPAWAIGGELASVRGRRERCGAGCDRGLYAFRKSVLVEYRPAQGCWSHRLAGVEFSYQTDDGALRAKGYGVGLYTTCHWPGDRRDEASIGVRAGVELARYRPRGAAAPAFWNRALVLSVQLRFEGAPWGWL